MKTDSCYRAPRWVFFYAFLFVTSVGASTIPQQAMVRGRLERVAPDGKHSPAAGISVTVSKDHGRSALASTNADGMYYIYNVPPGSYILEIWNGPDPRKPGQTQSIEVRAPYTDIPPVIVPAPPPSQSLPTSPVTFRKHDWRPADLAYNPVSGLFALDTGGGVSRLVIDGNMGRIDGLWKVGAAFGSFAITATSDSVLVAGNSAQGCTVFRYSLAQRTVAQRLMAQGRSCAGIATDGTSIYLTIPENEEIWYWANWNSPRYTGWPVAHPCRLGKLFFDQIGHRLIVVAQPYETGSGKAYAVSLPNGTRKLLTSDLGDVSSIATSPAHLLFASGRKVLFRARSDSSGENPPTGLQALTGGHIVGVVVDNDGNVWFADFDKQLVNGPVPLS